MPEVIAEFEALSVWLAESLKEALVSVGDRHELKLGKAPVRVAITGRAVGLPLFKSLEVLGRERTLERLRSAAARAWEKGPTKGEGIA